MAEKDRAIEVKPEADTVGGMEEYYKNYADRDRRDSEETVVVRHYLGEGQEKYEEAVKGLPGTPTGSSEAIDYLEEWLRGSELGEDKEK